MSGFFSFSSSSAGRAREDYEDWPEPERRRHLLRLWLACDDGPMLPPCMTTDFQGRTRGGRPDGIHVPGVPFTAPLEAELKARRDRGLAGLHLLAQAGDSNASRPPASGAHGCCRAWRRTTRLSQLGYASFISAAALR